MYGAKDIWVCVIQLQIAFTFPCLFMCWIKVVLMLLVPSVEIICVQSKNVTIMSFSLGVLSPYLLCCQSHAREQSHSGFMSFITSCGGQGRLICAGEPQAQCDAGAGEQPTGSIKGPDGFHANSNAASTFLQTNVHRKSTLVWMSV